MRNNDLYLIELLEIDSNNLKLFNFVDLYTYE